MTNRDWFVTFSVPDPTGTIEPEFTLASPPAGRTFRRRRLGLLTGVLAVTLGMGALLSAGSGSSGTVVAAGAARNGASVVISESEGSATLAAVFAETTSTLLAVTTTTMAETTTTAAVPSTSSSSTSTSTSTSAAPTTAAPAAASATTAPPTTAAPTTAAPTTAAPTTAPTTTAAPRSSPSTTAVPESSRDSSYSDPNTLQVWLDLAECESGGNWSVNTGNGYYGGLQFSLGTWESVGGSGYPHEHPRDTQIEFGRRLQARDGWGAWPHCSEKLGLR